MATLSKRAKTMLNRQAIIDKLEELSQKQKWLIGVGILVLLVGGYGYLFFMPQHNTLNSLQKEIKNIDDTLPALTRKLQRLPALRKEFTALEQELTFARNLLPKSSSDMETLLSDIEVLGNEQGIEFLLFAPGNEEVHEYYASRSVNLNINGQFHDLMLFFSRLSRLNRLVKMYNYDRCGKARIEPISRQTALSFCTEP